MILDGARLVVCIGLFTLVALIFWWASSDDIDRDIEERWPMFYDPRSDDVKEHHHGGRWK